MKHTLLGIGIILVVLGSGILLYRDRVNDKNIKVEEEKINLFFEAYSGEEYTANLVGDVVIDKVGSNNDYVAVIEIPKINLRRGLVDRDSRLNNVDKNIYTVKESIFPKENEYSQVILASHSGNSYVSYFKNINKLNYGDMIYLYYDKQKYEYQIVEKYEVEKRGVVPIKLYDKSNINLITCIDGTNKQLVVVGILM